MTQKDKQSRRTYLKLLSSAGVAVGLAGCTGDDDDGGNGGDDNSDAENGGNGGDDDDGNGDENGGGNGDNEDPIQMGSLLPITGQLEAYGSGMQTATELAVEDINDAGGPLDREINLHSRDSETTADQAVERYDTLVTDQGISGFVGAASSGVSAAVAERVANDEVMQVSHASTSPIFGELGWSGDIGEGPKYFARTAPNDAQQGIVMGRIFDERIEADTAALLHIDNPYGSGLARTAAEAFSGEVVATVGYDPKTADYTSTLDQVFADDPDAIGFVGYPENGGTILRQWDEAGFGGEWVHAEGVNNPDFWAELPEITEGHYVTSPEAAEAPGAEAFEEKIGESNTLFAAHAYDAMMLMALAMQKAGEASGSAIANNIRSVSRPPGETITVGEFETGKQILQDGGEVNYDGASSSVDLNQNLEPLNSYSIIQVSDGETETLETIPAEEFEGEL